MYIEHDMNVPWSALLGWADDMPILEPLGFQRGFYRVEPSEQTGLPGLTDQISRININKYDLKLNVSTSNEVGQIRVRHQPALQSNTPAHCCGHLAGCPEFCFTVFIHTAFSWATAAVPNGAQCSLSPHTQ